ncbi:MAG: molecular chaperone [Oscillospiraceae bacterium]
MKLTKIEKETILNFNEGEEIASLYTYNQKLQKRFDKFVEEFPALVRRKDNGHGAVTYDLPKKMLILKIQKPISETERQRRSAYAKAHGIHAQART